MCRTVHARKVIYHVHSFKLFIILILHVILFNLNIFGCGRMLGGIRFCKSNRQPNVNLIKHKQTQPIESIRFLNDRYRAARDTEERSVETVHEIEAGDFFRRNGCRIAEIRYHRLQAHHQGSQTVTVGSTGFVGNTHTAVKRSGFDLRRSRSTFNVPEFYSQPFGVTVCLYGYE